MADFLSKFRAIAGKYHACWAKIRIVYVAVLKSDLWISIHTRVDLCPAGFDDGIADFEVAPTPAFTAGILTVPVENLDRLINEIVEFGRIRLGNDDLRKTLFFTRVHAGLEPSKNATQRLDFQYLNEASRDHVNPETIFDPRIELLQASLEQGYWLTDYQSLREAEDRLRLCKPGFNGWPALLKVLKLRSDQNWWNNSTVSVNANLPFSITAESNRLLLRCPRELSSDVSVVAFSEADHRPAKFQRTQHVDDSGAHETIIFEPIWDDDAYLLRCYVYHQEDRIDEIVLRRWAGSGNWGVMIDSYFDANQKHLQRALTAADKNSESFEHAVVRLLTLLGFEAVWYGAARTKGKPDLAGWIEASFNRRCVILGECTIDKPESKISPLKSRANELRNCIGDGYRVIPIIFTPIEPAESDRNAALREGLLIMGKDDLARLFSLLRGQRDPATLLESFERQLSALPMIQWAGSGFTA